MGVNTELSTIHFSPDHLSRAISGGHDLGSILRSARLKVGEILRDLQLLLSIAAPDDPNRVLIQEQIEALR